MLRRLAGLMMVIVYDVINYAVFVNSVLLKILNFVTWVAYLIGHEKSPKPKRICLYLRGSAVAYFVF